MIVIDLCYFEMVIIMVDEWILIWFGIDVVLVVGFIYIMIIEDLYN